jgi:hypothetical protein
MKERYLLALLPATLAIGIALAGPGGAAAGKIEQRIDEWRGEPIVTIPASAMAPAQRAKFRAAEGPAPLIIDLHQWGGSSFGKSGTDVRLDVSVRERGWSFIRPDLVDLTSDCSADHVASRIAAAITYAKAHAKVTKVVVVGGSGGGYMALVAYMHGLPVDEYYAWVPISDLEAWSHQHRADYFGETLRRCTTDLRANSPLNMPAPSITPPLHIFAGVDDGFGAFPGSAGQRFVGVVLPTHSIRFFNRFAGPAQISEPDVMSLLEKRTDMDQGPALGGRDVLLRRSAKNIELTVFDGAHEVLIAPTIARIAAP